MQQEEMEIQLWEFIDGTCSPGERQHIASLIANDEQWETTYTELLSFHSALQTGLQPVATTPDFTSGVMEQIDIPAMPQPAKRLALNWAIRAVAAFLILTILATGIYTVSNISWGGGAFDITGKLNFNLPDQQLMPENAGIIAGFIIIITLLAIGDTLFRNRTVKSI